MISASALLGAMDALMLPCMVLAMLPVEMSMRRTMGAHSPTHQQLAA